MNFDKSVKKAAEVISAAKSVLITAGAGIGVDSGLPDFRGQRGFWKAYPPIAKMGLRFEEMANPTWFEADPQLAWAFYGHRLNLYRQTIPHKGFNLLLQWAEKKSDGYFVVTSNVDGQFQKAGFDSYRIYEIHGSIHYLQCSKPCSNSIWDARDIDIIIDMDNFEACEPLPVCPRCNTIARPNILMFGDFAWVSDRSGRQSDNFQNWLHKIDTEALVVIEIGAGLAVPTIRFLSENTVSKYNASLVRINPRDFNVPAGHISIAEGALKALEAIDNYIK